MRYEGLAFGVILASAVAGQASADTYNYTSLPLAPYSNTGVAAINNSGDVIVNYGDPSMVGAFEYSYPSGTTTFITPPIIPNGGNTSSVAANGINSAGTIVGTDIQTTNGVGTDYDFSGFIDQGGHFTFLNAPGAVATQLGGINNSGTVWGLYNTAGGNGVQDYFTYSNGTYTDIAHAGYSNITVIGIDNAGDVFGNAMVGNTRTGFVDSNGVYSTLSAFGGSITIQAVSSSGLIAGNYFSNGKDLGFEDDDGTFTSIVPPNATITEIRGINNLGDVVGTASGAYFVDNGGVFTDLVVPGSSFDPNNDSGPDSINDAGLIGGSYYSGNGFNFQYTAFIADPVGVIAGVPEPATWAIMLLGFGAVGWTVRGSRRKRDAAAIA